MIDPLYIFDRDEEGRLLGGVFHWIEVGLLEKAIEIGWRPLPTTVFHPVTDGRGMLCVWSGEGEMVLP